jgi:hypothetical protein
LAGPDSCFFETPNSRISALPAERPCFPTLPRKRFTRSEVYEMLETGIFAGQPFELIDGDSIDKMGQSPSHAWAIHTVMVVLTEIFGIELVDVQMPIDHCVVYR